MRKKYKKLAIADTEREGRERCIIFFSLKRNKIFLPMNQQSGKEQINCDFHMVFSELLCIES